MKDVPVAGKLSKANSYVAPEKMKSNYWIILTIATGCQASIAFVTQGVGILAPFLAAGLELSKTQVGIISGAMNLGMFFTFLLAGRVVDLWGDKAVLVWGGVLTGLWITLAAFARSFLILYILLFVTGIWASTSTPAGSKAIMNWFPYAKRGFAMGIRQTGVPIGGLMAALVLPMVALNYSWRVAFVVAGIVVGLIAVVCQFSYRDLSVQEVTSKGEQPNKVPLKVILLDTRIWRVSYTGITYLAAQSILLVYMISFFHETIGLTIDKASLFMALSQFGGGTGRVCWGLMTDTVFRGYRKPALVSISLIVMVLSLSMTWLSPRTPLWVLGLVVLLWGFSAVGWNGVYVALVSEMVGKEQSGTALGLGLTLIQLGVLVFVPAFGYMIDIDPSYRQGWYALSALILSGLFVLCLVREQKGERL